VHTSPAERNGNIDAKIGNGGVKLTTFQAVTRNHTTPPGQFVDRIQHCNLLTDPSVYWAWATMTTVVLTFSSFYFTPSNGPTAHRLIERTYRGKTLGFVTV
jgi:hypothetical protein